MMLLFCILAIIDFTLLAYSMDRLGQESIDEIKRLL